MQHEFKPRQTEDMKDHAFVLGEGKISGYISCLLGSLSILAVLCFKYPEFLTTPDLRQIYDPDILRTALRAGIWVSIFFGVLTFVLNKRKRLGALGILASFTALGLGGYQVEGRAVEANALFAGLDWFVLDLLLTAGLFVFIEKLLPKYKEQVILRPEWGNDLVYFAFNHMIIGFVLLFANGFSQSYFNWALDDGLQSFIQSWPIVLQVILLIFAADMVQYWVHRMFHTVPWLWKFHAVHHSSENMDWLAGSRTHLVDTLFVRSLIMVPLYLIGADKAALDAYVLFASFQAVFIHANFGGNFGILKYLITTPQFHHWHHSADAVAIDTNYAAHLPVLDKIFGSYLQPGNHWPEKYGTVGRPLPRGIIKQHLYPFIPSWSREIEPSSENPLQEK